MRNMDNLLNKDNSPIANAHEDFLMDASTPNMLMSSS
jgi:hypothetical protein